MKARLFFYLIILVSLPSIQLAAAGIGSKDAAQVARNFYYERINRYGSIDYNTVSMSLISLAVVDGTPLYYVFRSHDGGFVIVAATSASIPVIAYSYSGHYGESEKPENFTFWMKGYEAQLKDIIVRQLEPTLAINEAWAHYLTNDPSKLSIIRDREVLPLLTTSWDQGKYYNELCPADPMGEGGHCVVGCVATALGQLMDYFRFPDTGLGSYSYDCPPYGIQSADFGNTTYRWDLMDPSVGHSNLSVAEILYHLGVSVDMVYGPTGSGMYNHKAAYSLRTYFKYMPETQYIFRDSTSMDWDSLIVAHLDKKVPLYYAGWSVPNINGHAFICDGYQSGDYYHFNWGWSGSYDGYFYTDNLNPGGGNYNLAQELVINAVPDTNTYVYPNYCQGRTNFTALSGTIEDGSGPLFNYGNNADCSWLIAAQDSINSITLTFLRFQTNPGDIVTVYEGDTITSPILGSFSGDQLPPEVTASGNRMLVTFQSDDSGTAPGFLASFSCELPVYCSGNKLFTAQADTFSDGSGRFDYHNNTQCIWSIVPTGASEVTLYFMEFETQDTLDMVRIYDMQTQELLAEYSGSYAPGVPDPVTSASGKMLITFITNYSITAPGWTANYFSNLAGIPEFSGTNKFLIYPNPARRYLTVISKEYTANARLSLMDLTGREVYIKSIDLQGGNLERTVDLGAMGRGVYLLQISNDRTILYRQKVILN